MASVTERLKRHRRDIHQYGEDTPEIRDWCWTG
jgi:phosphoketolase